MKKLWITSCDVMTSLTGLPAGTCSSSISRWPPGMLELPHPLLADDVHLGRVGGRRGMDVIQVGCPGEHHDEDQQRRRDPGDLDPVAVAAQLRTALHPAVGRRAVAILHREIDDQDEDDERDDAGDAEPRVEQDVDARCERRIGRWMQREAPHGVTGSVWRRRVSAAASRRSPRRRRAATRRSSRRNASITRAAIAARRREVKAQQQQPIDRGRDSLGGRGTQRVAQLRRREIEAEEIAGDRAMRRHEHDAGRVRELVAPCVVGVAESRCVGQRRNRSGSEPVRTCQLAASARAGGLAR